jgi:hypothetical protein
MLSPATLAHLRKDAIIGGSINAVLNGVINWFSVKDKTALLLTQNLIDSTEYTVFSGAVPLALTLAFIQTSMAYFTTKVPGKPSYFPTYFFRALRHSIYAFGLVTIFAILLQRFAGSIAVSPIAAAAISGFVAGLVGTIVNFETRKSLFKKA